VDKPKPTPSQLNQPGKHLMTLHTPTKTNDPVAQHTAQQHHQLAGEHLQHASTSHLAAAKSHGAGDTKAADQHAKTAHDHSVKAAQHVAESTKTAAPDGTSKAAQVR
jgi:hypothetical protein